ncbi:peptidase M61 [Aurantibacter sp.]|uniref:M61 family metallopeptidase n=1 Tax=Aurantibacter sp. TaxID=2807103 RepID=UPI003267286C
MKKVSILASLILFLYGCGASKNSTSAKISNIHTTIDLVNVVDDKVMVTMNPGDLNQELVTFYIPKTVPGTYSTDNYGQYIEGFKALDGKGMELPFVKVDENTWNISNAKGLDRVEYFVNDTYDTEPEVKDAVFSPAGTNILKGENFMLNLHGFVGYFEGYKELPYELLVKKPSGLVSTTSLKKKDLADANNEAETFLAARYFEVIDNPILYAKPNTESFTVNDITVTLSVYSPTGVYSAASLKPQMEEMMRAQKNFLGEIDGTKEYNILLYLSTLASTDAAGFGALEHHTSTVVVLPEQMPKPALDEAMKDVVSHEFFHIVTPLTVHSGEVQYFDFNDPKMSQHLWMYEGTTEYFANLFQIQQGLIDENEFYARLMEKVNNAKAYDDAMSFTEMSKNILKQPYEKNYANVYEKGALINMALDIQLRELSGGARGVLWLMKELSKKYGKNTPFKDENLIDEIVAMTYPELRDFFDTHVIGATPINYNDYLAKVGLTSGNIEQQTGYFLDGEIPFIDADPTDQNIIFVRRGITLNSFFNSIGAKGGDIIKSINDTPINLEAIRAIIGQSFTWTPETDIKIVVDRDGEELVLEGKVGVATLQVETIAPIKGLTGNEDVIREAWLKN